MIVRARTWRNSRPRNSPVPISRSGTSNSACCAASWSSWASCHRSSRSATPESLSNRCSITQGCDNAVVARLSDDEIRSGLANLAGWGRRGDEIEKVYELPSFPDAIAFVPRVGFLAEKANHHPDLDVRWRKVRVGLSAPDDGGITDRDLGLAGESDRVAPGPRPRGEARRGARGVRARSGAHPRDPAGRNVRAEPGPARPARGHVEGHRVPPRARHIG